MKNHRFDFCNQRNQCLLHRRKLESQAIALMAIRQLRQVFSISACDEKIIDNAMHFNVTDFEDAVQLATAVRVRAGFLVTRNPGHFSGAPIPIVTPTEFLDQVGSL